jgi:hypothetical protein
MKQTTRLKLENVIRRLIKEESSSDISNVKDMLSDYDADVDMLNGKIHVTIFRQDFDEYKKYSDMTNIRKILQQNGYNKIVWSNRNAKDDSGISLLFPPKNK